MRRLIVTLVICAAYAAYATCAADAPACLEDEFRAAVNGRRTCIPFDDIRRP